MGSPELMTIAMFVCMLVLLFLGLPVALGLGATAVIFAFLFSPRSLLAAPTAFFYTPWQYVLVTIPMFLLMGNLIRYSGIAEDAYDAAYKLIGRLPGGLAMGTVLVCTLFAAVTGITPPATITMGQIAYPSMIKYKYNKAMAIGPIAAGGALGALIPPSVPFIFYGLLAKESIGALFMGGIGPGLLLAFLYVTYIGVRCRLQPHMGPALPPEESFSVKEKVAAILKIWPFIVLIILVLGVIWLGVATPQEAAAVGAFGSLVINIALRRFSWQVLKDSLITTVKLSTMGFWILIGANLFVNVFSALGCQDVVTSAVMRVPGGQMGAILMMVFVVLVLGMIMDDWAIIMLTTPLWLPVLNQLGIDKLWYGIILVVNIQIAYLSPPFGFVLFWIKSVLPKDVNMMDIYRSILPFIILQLIGLSLCIAFPSIGTWLPRVLAR